MTDLAYRRMSFFAMGTALALNFACGNSPGESCRKNSDCGSSLVCSFPKVEGVPAEQGICAPRLAEEGQFCTSNASCSAGLFCSNDLPSDTSKPDGLCIPRLAEGEPCFRDPDCKSGLKCKKNANDLLVCTAASAPDASGVDSGSAGGDLEDAASVDAASMDTGDAKAPAAE